jgi:glycosyl transferase, family 25
MPVASNDGHADNHLWKECSQTYMAGMVFRELHDLHDHRYALTTARNEARQAQLRAELAGWTVELFSGVDRRDVSMAQLRGDGVYDEAEARAIDRRNQRMTTGEVCCALGHRRIYEAFLRSAHQRVLIFEDDVRVLPHLGHLLPAMMHAIPDDAEVIYWGWTGLARRPWYGAAKQLLYHAQHAAGFLTYNHTMISNLYPRPHNAHFAHAGKQFCAHAYTLTRSGAETLIRRQTPIVLNADNAIMDRVMNGALRAYIALPPLFSQASLDRTSGVPSLTQA